MRAVVARFVAVGGTVFAVCAPAHATPSVSPPIVRAGVNQLFSLVAEPEGSDAILQMVEFFPPSGFEIRSFADAEGWHRDWTIQSGRQGIVQKAVWTREEAPKGAEAVEDATENDAVFHFVAQPKTSGTYLMEVRETYSDGSTTDWTVPASTAFPANAQRTSVRMDPPAVEARASLGGGTRSSTLPIVALLVGALGLAIGIGAFVQARRV